MGREGVVCSSSEKTGALGAGRGGKTQAWEQTTHPLPGARAICQWECSAFGSRAGTGAMGWGWGRLQTGFPHGGCDGAGPTPDHVTKGHTGNCKPMLLQLNLPLNLAPQPVRGHGGGGGATIWV